MTLKNSRALQQQDVGALCARIRQILKAHGRLRCDPEALSEHDNLFAAGMSTHASVSVLFALEDEFELEFPDQMLCWPFFESIGTLASAISHLAAD